MPHPLETRHSWEAWCQRTWASRAEEQGQTMDERKALVQKIKDAGLAGIVSYGLVQLAFFGAAVPIGLFGYYQATGHWPDLSNAEDQGQVAAEVFAFLSLSRLLIPLRIALALGMAQGVQTKILDRFRNK